MNGRTGVVAAMLAALEELGPMTGSELCEAIGSTHVESGRMINIITHAGKTVPKRAYVQGYTYDGEGQRRYPRAIYALGDKPNVPKPKRDVAANSRRWRERKQMRVNSVWALGLGAKKKLAVNIGALA
jgi:hypothetical protein